MPQARCGKVQYEEDKSDCDALNETQFQWARQHQERHECFGKLVDYREFGSRLESQAAFDETRSGIRRQRQGAERDAYEKRNVEKPCGRATGEQADD